MNLIRFLFVAFCWAGSFIAIKPLVEIVPPFTAGALRLAVGIFFLSIALPLMKLPLRVAKINGTKIRNKIWLTGLFSFSIPFSLLFWGETKINPGLAGILNGTVPIWVFSLGLIFTPKAEKFSLQKLIGLFIGMSGICFIFLPKILSSEGSEGSLFGALAVFMMAASYATGVLFNRTLFAEAKSLHPFTNLYQQLLSGFASMGLLALMVEGIPSATQWNPISTVLITELYLGVVSTSIAFMLFYQLIRNWGSVRAATVTYIIPALTLGIDIVINKHFPTLNEYLGVALVTFGVIILNIPIQNLKKFFHLNS